METIDLKNIKPLTDFRNHIKKYIEELNTTKKPIVLTQHGRSAAVIIDADKFQEMQDQIEFMKKIALGLEDYKQNNTFSKSEVFRKIDQIIEESEKS